MNQNLNMQIADLNRQLADLNLQLLKQLDAAQTEIAILRAENAKLKDSDMTQMLKPEEAGRLIGRSVSFLFKDRNSKQPLIPFVQLGPKTIRYKRHDLQAFVDSRKKPGKLRL